MVKVSIASLIYKSPVYADWVYNSIHEFTPMISRGDAEFFFVANDPTQEVIDHLNKKGYPHVVNINPKRSEDELFRMGYGKPEYIHRVYRGWNRAITEAKGEVVVLVNSDNFFSPDWLENLLKYLSKKTVICSKLVERKHPKYGMVFEGAWHGEFGAHPKLFKKDEFLDFCEKVKLTGLEEGGAFMPCAFYKEKAIEVGLYPEGNIAGVDFNDVIEYGDAAFFKKLAKIGVKHYTALDSVVYHVKEGEMDEPEKEIEIHSKEELTTFPPPFRLTHNVILTCDENIQYLSIGKALCQKNRHVPEKKKPFVTSIAYTLKRKLSPKTYNAIRKTYRRIMGKI
ncbi:MAG: glycosyltransferase family A protein [Thermoplasmata archaeon]